MSRPVAGDEDEATYPMDAVPGYKLTIGDAYS